MKGTRVTMTLMASCKTTLVCQLECSYMFPGAFQCKKSHETSTQLAVISLNICSIPEHLNEFIDQCLCSNNSIFDIIGFSETKLTDDINQLYKIENYDAYFNNRSRHSGGVALYVRRSYSSHFRPDLSVQDEYLKSVFAEIKTETSSILIG